MSNKHEEIVGKINDSFLNGDIEGFLSFCSDDVKWTMAGSTVKTGKDEIRTWMRSMDDSEPPKFTVDRMISNEDSVVCYGEMTMKGESGSDERYAYCDVYRFENEKVVDLNAFVVKYTENEHADAASG